MMLLKCDAPREKIVSQRTFQDSYLFDISKTSSFLNNKNYLQSREKIVFFVHTTRKISYFYYIYRFRYTKVYDNDFSQLLYSRCTIESPRGSQMWKHGWSFHFDDAFLTTGKYHRQGRRERRYIKFAFPQSELLLAFPCASQKKGSTAKEGRKQRATPHGK